MALAGPGTDPIERLSNRELQVLSLIGRGQSSREAAEALGLSVKTIETHRQSLKRKLNLTTNAQLCSTQSTGTRAAARRELTDGVRKHLAQVKVADADGKILR